MAEKMDKEEKKFWSDSAYEIIDLIKQFSPQPEFFDRPDVRQKMRRAIVSHFKKMVNKIVGGNR